jgi:poly-beta-1,6-N-acetyl-D-glucosamine synthase
MKHVLITAARNEARFIEGTIRSVISQRFLPERWVIVDDGSTDQTAKIVARHTKDYRWIELIRRPQTQGSKLCGNGLRLQCRLKLERDKS